MKTFLRTNVLFLLSMDFINCCLFVFFFFYVWPMNETPQLLFTFVPLICRVLLGTSVCFRSLRNGISVNSPVAKCFTNKHKEGYETVK